MRTVQQVLLMLVTVVLLSACEESKDKAQEKLLAMGYSVDGAGFVTLMQSDKKTPEMVERFIRAGVSPLMQNEQGENAFIIAVKSKDIENFFNRFLPYLPQQSGDGAPVNMKDASAKTALIYAVEWGNREVAEILLKKGASLLLFDTDVNTPLHHAVIKNDIAMATLLLRYAEQLPGGKEQLLNFPNHYVLTPLAIAVEKQQTDMAKLLLNTGADPNIPNRRNFTPLMSASKSGNAEMVSLLLDKGAEVNVMDTAGKTPLIYSLSEGGDDITEILLRAGADSNMYREGSAITPLQMVLEKEPFNEKIFSMMLGESELTTGNLYSLLQSAVVSGRKEIAEIMLQHKADVNYVAPHGESLLYQAIDKGQTEIALMLLKRGADISLTGASGVPPMELAILRGNYEVVKELLKRGANPDVKTTEGYSLTEMAVYKGFPDILELLLTKGGRLNMDFSLLWSVRDGGGKVVPVLLRHGANPNIMNQDGDPLLLLAASANQVDAVRALLEHEADPNRGSQKLGMPPLAAAAYFGHLEPVKILVEKGADINKKDKNGMTALAYAAAHLKPGVVEYLISKGADLSVRDNQGRSIADMVAVAANSPDKQRILKILAASRMKSS